MMTIEFQDLETLQNLVRKLRDCGTIDLFVNLGKPGFTQRPSDLKALTPFARTRLLAMVRYIQDEDDVCGIYLGGDESETFYEYEKHLIKLGAN